MRIESEVESSKMALASSIVFKVLGLGLEGQVLDLVLSKSSKFGLSSVEDSSFLLSF